MYEYFMNDEILMHNVALAYCECARINQNWISGFFFFALSSICFALRRLTSVKKNWTEVNNERMNQRTIDKQRNRTNKNHFNKSKSFEEITKPI